MIEPVIYEVCIAVEADDIAYRVEHGFATFPERGTLVQLRDEAIDTFAALYPAETVTDQLVYVRRLTPDERAPASREHSDRA